MRAAQVLKNNSTTYHQPPQMLHAADTALKDLVWRRKNGIRVRVPGTEVSHWQPNPFLGGSRCLIALASIFSACASSYYRENVHACDWPRPVSSHVLRFSISSTVSLYG